jgi:hypothetical protein
MMDEPSPTYTVTVTREDGLWVAVVAEITPAATDVEHFNDLEPAIRDLIGGLTDKDSEFGDFRVNWTFPNNPLERDRGHQAAKASQDQISC